MKPSIPQGTRDFGPDVVRKRNFIFDTVRNHFELYGFQPLETPAMENLETLLGKYGEEGDKLIFKILNNGLDHAEKKKKAKEDFEKVLEGKNMKGITERALKYDLTIPFARYVAMNHGQLSFPFKRYQVQPVWRADRPQKGRYREFFQCDADVIGSTSLLNEVELAKLYHDVFTGLGIHDYELKINHRNLLAALAETCEKDVKMLDLTIAIDKIDKIGMEKVKEELSNKGLDEHDIKIVEQYLNITGDNHQKLNKLKEIFGPSIIGDKGIDDLEWIINYLEKSGTKLNLSIDLTLARGLDYYTGIIFEAKAPAKVKIGSVGGGGRYDDLTGLFGVPGIAGVGISFGVDRIYDVMEELDLFPKKVHVGTKVLFFNLGEKESLNAFELMTGLRKKNVASELFHESAKFDKQFRYAEKKNIPWIVIIGSRELEEKTCTIKNLQQGNQETIPQQELMNFKFD